MNDPHDNAQTDKEALARYARPMREFKCSVCGVTYLHHRHVGPCKPCARKYAREWREQRRESGLSSSGTTTWDPAKKSARDATYYARPDVVLRRRAVAAVGNAIRDGRLKRQHCEVCGAGFAHAHHDDYSRPLDVRWLCRKHHDAHHAALRRAAK